MAITTPSFSVSQNYGNITVITIEDTSTGSDNTLTSRRVYLRKADGTYLVPSGTTTDYIVWPIGDTTIDISCLDKDYCLDITVQWMTGTVATYTATTLCLFVAYSKLFLRLRTQNQAGKPSLLSQYNYYNSKMKLRVLVDDAEEAVSLINDQTTAQYCLDAAKEITDNPSSFF